MKKKPKNTTPTAARKAMLDEYDAIVKSGKLSLLLLFLQTNAKGNMEILKKQVRKNSRFWLNFVDLENEPEYRSDNSQWGRRGSGIQEKIITLSELALYSNSEIGTNSQIFWLLQRLNISDNAPYTTDFRILKWAKPTWLGNFLLRQVRQGTTFHYETLRFLEKEELLEYNSELFVRCVTNIGTRHQSHSNPDYLTRPMENILDDETVYTRDILPLFDYETDVANHVFYPIIEGRKATDYVSYWDKVYLRLIAEQKMSRTFFIENALQIQTKDWNKHLQGFYRKILAELSLTTTELVALQHTIFPFLHSSSLPVVNFGVDCIKAIYTNEHFDINAFLEWLEPMMMRSDAKGTLKNILPILDKISATKPDCKSQIALLVADIFMIEDMTLQIRAANFFLKIADVNNATLCEKINLYAPQMQGNIIQILRPFLVENTDFNTKNKTETYAFAPKKPKLLTTPVALPQTWNDILFHFGKFIQSKNPLDGEILLHTFVTQRDVFPADYAAQLKPYLKQLDKYYEDLYNGYMTSFLFAKIQDMAYSCELHRYYTHSEVLKGFENTLLIVHEKIVKNWCLPLLCFPTHAPHWIEPKTLFERIIAYTTANESIYLSDLVIAISRMTRENIADALPLLPALPEYLQPLMRFCLGIDKTIVLPPSDAEPLYSDAMIGVWATAARTFYPHETFAAFQSTQFADAPFVTDALPYSPKFQGSYMNIGFYKTQEAEDFNKKYDLYFDLPKKNALPATFLYALDTDNTFDLRLHHTQEVLYWQSIMPQNPEPLAYLLSKNAFGQTEVRDTALKGFLNICLHEGFLFSDIIVLFLACSTFETKKENRLLAIEILIILIEQQKLDTHSFGEKIALLVTHKFSSFGRMADTLVAIKDVSPQHNSALFQVLDSIFSHLAIQKKLPTGFKKIIELYLGLKTKTQGESNEKAVLFFEQWKNEAVLKGVIKQLLT